MWRAAEQPEDKHPRSPPCGTVGRDARPRDNRDAAVRAFDKASRLSPDDLDMSELLRSCGRCALAGAIALLAERAETEPDAARRSSPSRSSATSTRLSRPACRGDPYYERALADDPESTTALVALHRLYLATETWYALIELPRLIDAPRRRRRARSSSI
jgi:hypothetical protein